MTEMGKTAVIIANGRFPRGEYPKYIMRSADVTVCCDGAFDRYLKASEKIFGRLKLPDAVIGDMDSISEKRRKEYSDIMVRESEQETNVINNPESRKQAANSFFIVSSVLVKGIKDISHSYLWQRNGTILEKFWNGPPPGRKRAAGRTRA